MGKKRFFIVWGIFNGNVTRKIGGVGLVLDRVIWIQVVRDPITFGSSEGLLCANFLGKQTCLFFLVWGC